jgi:hypothetical protein
LDPLATEGAVVLHDRHGGNIKDGDASNASAGCLSRQSRQTARGRHKLATTSG